ncbi:hypothetical protein [Streptomyces sp. NPDC058206]|uniref:hypothetical protein n=1 Tax=Streptomyces sp. NPDC058206 TaxID=3346382 RepID=UPI0036EC19CF
MVVPPEQARHDAEQNELDQNELGQNGHGLYVFRLLPDVRDGAGHHLGKLIGRYALAMAGAEEGTRGWRHPPFQDELNLRCRGTGVSSAAPGEIARGCTASSPGEELTGQ